MAIRNTPKSNTPADQRQPGWSILPNSRQGGRTLTTTLYQINPAVWLNELGTRLSQPVTLRDVPDSAIDQIAADGFDWIWLLGIWQTGEAGRQVSLSQPDCLKEYREVLPDFSPADVRGSPFAIAGYSVHPEFGGPDALVRFRRRLKERGLRLMLDFVPNHTALDHPWVSSHPDYYIHGREPDLAREPQNYQRISTAKGSRILAHGRDPYFPGWTDTLQLNYRHRRLREAAIAVLRSIATQCDGVRCDMAMLILPESITRTWGDRSLPADGTNPIDRSFWPEAIARVRREWPEFVFLAEVYWDLEGELQQQGFDYTYDKKLYDRLHSRDAPGVRGHLHRDPDYQRHSARFLENHDEPRAAAAFPPKVAQAAAVIALLLPGLRFVYEGQLSGRQVRTSNHLRRRAMESPDQGTRDFYHRLLACLRRSEAQDGEWQILEPTPAWPDNPTWSRFVAFAWRLGDSRLLVAVNYGDTQAQCFIPVAPLSLTGSRWLFRDLMHSGTEYLRDGADLRERGLYLDLPAWGYHIFEVLAAPTG